MSDDLRDPFDDEMFLEPVDEMDETMEVEEDGVESGNRTFIIAVSVLGGLLVLAIAAFLAWAIFLNPQRQAAPPVTENPVAESAQGDAAAEVSPAVGESDLATGEATMGESGTAEAGMSGENATAEAGSEGSSAATTEASPATGSGVGDEGNTSEGTDAESASAAGQATPTASATEAESVTEGTPTGEAGDTGGDFASSSTSTTLSPASTPTPLIQPTKTPTPQPEGAEAAAEAGTATPESGSVSASATTPTATPRPPTPTRTPRPTRTPTPTPKSPQVSGSGTTPNTGLGEITLFISALLLIGLIVLTRKLRTN